MYGLAGETDCMGHAVAADWSSHKNHPKSFAEEEVTASLCDYLELKPKPHTLTTLPLLLTSISVTTCLPPFKTLTFHPKIFAEEDVTEPLCDPSGLMEPRI